ncbi:MAG TPA: 4-(cytidine 5'-diphospho)-2-C-methyl-D-erythritol kinase [Firmicutes bacterium]|nr:4-(cytidine 5'-diphospho)-2-C-methyl-D-erythritol kinase [Bacillota bacterium]
MGRIVESAHAKINLVLDVGPVRSDGYHWIHTVMQSLELRDIVIMEERPAGISIECLPGDPTRQGAMFCLELEPCSMPPSNAENLAWKAADLLRQAVGIQRGVSITIRKAIPLAAGLAGGSADAAAVLRGLNRLWNLGLDLAELAAVGVKVGADVPFCLLEGTAEVTGIGEKIRPVDSPPPWPVLLLKLPVSVSTKSCYEAYDKLASPPRVNAPAMLEALANCDLAAAARRLGNSLEAVTFQQVPELAFWRQAMEQAGCLGVLMSGSGPTLFGLVRDEEHGHAAFQRLAHRIKQEPPAMLPNLYLTRFLSSNRQDQFEGGTRHA